MEKKKDMLALLAVKGSSERVKKKNIRPFHDTNLLDLKLEQLKRVKGLDRIVVSSEDKTVLNMARDMGVELHVRDPKYSTNHVPMSEVYTYLASEMDSEIIMWVPVTNPLAESEVYEKAIGEYYSQVYDSKEYDCLLSVYEVKDYLFHKGEPVNFKPNPWPKSQDLSGLHALSFVVMMLKREDMIKWGSLVGNKPYFFQLDSVTSMDVDFQEDFDFCEMIYKQRLAGIKLGTTE
jgi:CMP-N-acetylneuraminic acid synthetase